MRFTFKNIFPRTNFGNRPLVFTLAFLLVFSLGSYALAAGLYHPGDTNDPTCSPGDAGCYVDIVAKKNAAQHAVAVLRIGAGTRAGPNV